VSPFEQARDALGRGWSLVGCDLHKKPVGRWKQYQDERPDLEQLERWARNPSVTCWALITGAVSGRIVIDFDGPEGETWLKDWEQVPCVRTGRGGAHVHYEHPGWYVPTLNGKAKKELGERWPGVDVKGDGGYAITFGYTEFGEYESLLDDEFPLFPLSALPEDFRHFVGLWEPTVSPATILSRYLARAVAPENGNSGNRNELGFELACQLRDNRIERLVAEETMREYARRCPVGDYPHEEKDALASLDQAYGRPPRKPWKVASDASDREEPDDPTPTSGFSTPGSEPPVENPEHGVEPVAIGDAVAAYAKWLYRGDRRQLAPWRADLVAAGRRIRRRQDRDRQGLR
jgi:hypothetical protein